MVPPNLELDPKKVARILKKSRTAENLNQNEFAGKYGVPVDIYRTWESGRTAPRVTQIFGFLRMLGNRGREDLQLFLGPMIDAVRGKYTDGRAAAFDGLAIILDDAPPDKQEYIQSEIQRIAGEYGKR